MNNKKYCWLLTDNYLLADDNCEHFYRYLKNNHPEIEIYYLLDKNSKDYQRLKKENFNIISKDSNNFEKILIKSDVLISSQLWHSACKEHLDIAYKKKIVFIPHGITLGDSSRYFNKGHFDLCTSCMENEYKNYINGKYNYKHNWNIFKLTGMPRHDTLIKKIKNAKDNSEKVISFVFTWRNINFKNRYEQSSFIESDYFKTLNNLFNCEYFKKLNEEYNIKFHVKFHPHIVTRNLEKEFNLPSYIINCKNESYQDFLINTDILISDYSSACQEFAAIGKNILYYQFDRKTFLSKNSTHSYDAGWFNWDKDSLGKICLTEEELCNSIQNIIDNNYVVDDKYKKRMNKFFKFHDTNNSERVYNAIMTMFNSDKKSVPGELIRFQTKNGHFMYKRIYKKN